MYVGVVTKIILWNRYWLLLYNPLQFILLKKGFWLLSQRTKLRVQMVVHRKELRVKTVDFYFTIFVSKSSSESREDRNRLIWWEVIPLPILSVPNGRDNEENTETLERNKVDQHKEGTVESWLSWVVVRKKERVKTVKWFQKFKTVF